MENNISSYYKYIYREQLDFRYRLFLLSKEKDLDKSINVAHDLIFRAVIGSVGYYASSELEKPFLRLAQKIETNNKQSYIKNSFLHVMTESCVTGGHTRVVERWIDTAPLNQTHSVILLNQENHKIPSRLYECVSNHHGQLFCVKEDSLIKKAKILRDIGCRHHYVVLHVHMWDPTAIVAFGSEDFTRPVIFFNHADHLFWCGSSVVDMLADIRDNNFASVRGIKNRFTLRIPFEENDRILNFGYSKKQSRVRLGLPLDKTIVLTVGSPHKFSTFLGRDFCSVIKDSLPVNSKVICVGIGPNNTTGLWSSEKNLFFPVGVIDYDSNYFDYLNACDIYIDSIPIGGGTAKLDALQFKKPVLSYSMFHIPLGEITVGIDTIYDLDIFAKELCLLIEDESYREEFAKKEYSTVLNNHGINHWRINLDNMICQTPQEHFVNFEFFSGKRNIDDLNVLDCLWFNHFTNKIVNVYDIWHQLKCLFYFG